MKDTAKQMIERLEAEQAHHEDASQALWRMTPEQRRAAMRAGVLTGRQLFEWCKRAPHEVPLVNNEFAFIAAMTPEVAEAEDRSARLARGGIRETIAPEHRHASLPVVHARSKRGRET